MRRASFCLLLIAISLALKVTYTTLGVGWSTTPQEGAVGASDGVWYDRVASNLAQGQGFSLGPAQPTAVKPPGYPFFLAGIYSLFGANSYSIVRLTQLLLASAVPLFTYWVGRGLFNEAVGRVGALLVAVDPTLTYLAPALLSETLYVFLVSAAVWCLARLSKRFSWRTSIGAGLLLGAATLTRANLIAFLPALPIWGIATFTGPRRWVGALVLAIAVLATPPWTLRNYLEMHAFVPLSTHGGSAFWGANNQYADGGWLENSRSLDLPTPSPSLGEVEWDRAAYRLGLTWITDHPMEYVCLLGKKLARFIDFDPHSSRAEEAVPYRAIGFFPHGLLLPFMAVGLLLERRNRGALLLYCLLGASVVNALVFYGDPRMRSPVQPYLYLFAATALVRGAAVWLPTSSFARHLPRA